MTVRLDEDERQIAAQLQHDYPNWIILWGLHTRLYWAFPTFAASPGTIAAAAPRQLAMWMQDSEHAAAAPGPGSAPHGKDAFWAAPSPCAPPFTTTPAPPGRTTMNDTSAASPAAGQHDDASQRQAAAQLRRQHPGWVVIWAPAGHFTARPLFRAPRGTCLTAQTPEEMTAQMDQVEQAADRPRGRAGSTGTAGGDQPGPGAGGTP